MTPLPAPEPPALPEDQQARIARLPDKWRNEADRSKLLQGMDCAADLEAILRDQSSSVEPPVTTDPWKDIDNREEFIGGTWYVNRDYVDECRASERQQHADQLTAMKADRDKECASACNWMEWCDKNADRAEAAEARSEAQQTEIDRLTKEQDTLKQIQAAIVERLHGIASMADDVCGPDNLIAKSCHQILAALSYTQEPT